MLVSSNSLQSAGAVHPAGMSSACHREFTTDFAASTQFLELIREKVPLADE
jgi:hypothetical protein